MRYLKAFLKGLLVIVAVLSLYFGVVQGEWSESMFNATLL